MTRAFPPGQDFNQMLVTSGILHLALLLAILFIPKPEHETKVVLPAFIMNLEELPGGPVSPRESAIQPPPSVQIEPEKKTEPAPPPPPAKPAKAKRAPKAKTPPPKPAPKKSDAVLAMEKLEDLSPSHKSPLLEELDKLAKAEPKKVAPAKPSDDSAKKLESLKKTIEQEKARIAAQKKISESTILNKPKPPVSDKSAIPAKELPEIKPASPTAQKETAALESPKASQAQEAEPLKYAKLEDVSEPAKSPASLNGYEDLLEDLAKLEKSKTAPTKTPAQEEKTAGAFGDILKKIEIPPTTQTVEIDLGDSPLPAQEKFVSQIRTAKPSASSRAPVVVGGDSPKAGGATDPLSLYIGEIYKRVHSNWHIPLGVVLKKNIICTFFLYSKGNIDKPQLTVSSGDDKLDAQAVKAILDSAPFPEFPKELLDKLKDPNLHVTMRFNLTPKLSP